MSTEKRAVGGETPSICMRCKKPTVHIILSMMQDRIAKVQCKGCGGQHRFRDPDVPLKPPGKRPGKVSPEEVWEKAINPVTPRKKIPYTFSGHFKVDDLIDHTTFGPGVVTHLLSGDKIQVLFKDGEKILIARR